MPSFAYTAVDRAGRTVNGTMDAPDVDAVRGKLAEYRYSPISVAPAAMAPATLPRLEGVRSFVDDGFEPPDVGPATPVAVSPERRKKRAAVRVSSRDLGMFYRTMATMLRSGVPLFQALSSVRTNTRDATLVRAVIDMEAGATFGRTLSEAMDRHPRAFHPGHIGLVRVGEKAGMLPATFTALADQMDADWKVEISTRLNPVLFCIRWFIAPFIALAALSAMGAGGAGAVITVGVLGLLGFLCYPLILAALKRVPGGRRFEDSLLKLPLIGARRARADRVRAITALAVGLDAGIPVTSAWELAAEAPDWDTLAAAMAAQTGRIRRGACISEALEGTGAFDAELVQAARSGELSGRLPSALHESISFDNREAGLIGDLTPWVLATVAYFLYLLVGTLLALHGWGGA